MPHPMTISGVVFEVAHKYSEGHQLTSDEAAALNSLFFSGLSAKLKPLVVKAQKAAGSLELDDGTKSDLLAKLSEFSRTHTFTQKSGNSYDPVQREAFKMVKPQVLNALKQKGLDPKSLPEGKLEEIMLQLLSKRADIMAEARRRVEAVTSIADDLLP